MGFFSRTTSPLSSSSVSDTDRRESEALSLPRESRLSTEPVVLRHGAPVFMSGWLRIRFGRRKRADLRFCTLTGPCFRHSASPSKDILSDGFSVFEAAVAADDFASNRLHVRPKNSPRVTLIAESREDLAKWLRELVRASWRSVRNDYTFTRELRVAGLGTASLAADRANAQAAIVKTTSKRQLTPRFVSLARAEAVTLLSLDNHANILGIRDVYESARNIYLVSEHASGPSLAELVARRGSVCEADVAFLMRGLLRALEHMHVAGAVHRMVSPHNVLVVEEEGKRHMSIVGVKLCNFELTANVFDLATAPQMLPMFKGDGPLNASHIPFVAPEIARGERGGLAQDVWSLGVLMHLLLTGTTPQPPVHATQTQEALARIADSTGPPFSGVLWDGVTSGARKLCARLLEPDPDRRITATQAREDAWITL